ncbi:MAG: redoxin domain-containing protein [Mariniblastus sp.]|nr:redoxin domain-containing protein [Mariniblastus sp.]MDG2183840.1 redoxin domain-containing protein [Mariniblastus sp.]
MNAFRYLAFIAFFAAFAIPSAVQCDELDFRLKDLDGNSIALEKSLGSHLTVVCFIGTECPLAKLYSGRLGKLAEKFPQVDFIAVSSNQQDSIEELKAFRERFNVSIPIVKDVANLVADQFEAERTPEVFLVNENLEILYRGRIDDQYQPGIAKRNPTRDDLMIAISECLADGKPSVTQTEVDGCLIGRITKKDLKSNVNFSNQISRILQNHCMECHRQGELAPMELSSFEEVVGWSDMIVEVIDDQRMPPWHADPAHGEFKNERRMTSDEKQMIRDWVAAGSPEGNPEDLPKAKDYGSGSEWRLPREPDLIVDMSTDASKIPSDGVIDYQYFVADPGFKKDTWVTAAEIIPGDRGVVHHSICFVRPPDGADMRLGGWLAAYVPGQKPPSYDPRQGRLIPAGSTLVFQQHYTTNGQATEDITRIGLVLGEEAQIEKQLLTIIAMDQSFVIEAGEANANVSGKFKQLPKVGEFLGISPHMHFRGKSFTLDAEFSQSGKTKRDPTLLKVPNYDFNWQHIYELKDPIPLQEINSLDFQVTFDNSSANPANPDPTKAVMWGDQTDEEMAVAFAFVAIPRTREADGNAQKRRDSPQLLSQAQTGVDEYLRKYDADKNGIVSRAELPRVVRENGFRTLDLDRNGELSTEEIRRLVLRHLRNKRTGN